MVVVLVAVGVGGGVGVESELQLRNTGVTLRLDLGLETARTASTVNRTRRCRSFSARIIVVNVVQIHAPLCPGLYFP